MVRKALIPVAGKGTRLIPVTSVVPKALFPLVDGKDIVRAVLHIIICEAKSAGIEKVGVIANPVHIEILKQYFAAAGALGSDDLPAEIEYIPQELPKGFGDAVLKGAEFVAGEPFLLLLGDHIHIEDDGRLPCSAQVVKAFKSMSGVAMVGMQPVSVKEVPKVGVASGLTIRDDLYRCVDLVEKPDANVARARLVTEGLPKDMFLAHCGIYVFKSKIFEYLREAGKVTGRNGRELGLTDAQRLLLRKHPGSYFLYKISGRAYDTGTPDGYAVAQTAFKNRIVG